MKVALPSIAPTEAAKPSQARPVVRLPGSPAPDCGRQGGGNTGKAGRVGSGGGCYVQRQQWQYGRAQVQTGAGGPASCASLPTTHLDVGTQDHSCSSDHHSCRRHHHSPAHRRPEPQAGQKRYHYHCKHGYEHHCTAAGTDAAASGVGRSQAGREGCMQCTIGCAHSPTAGSTSPGATFCPRMAAS